ncbi:hypothetical protein BDV06DRAFT_128775 [Aspergillus oleicola]
MKPQMFYVGAAGDRLPECLPKIRAKEFAKESMNLKGYDLESGVSLFAALYACESGPFRNFGVSAGTPEGGSRQTAVNHGTAEQARWSFPCGFHFRINNDNISKELESTERNRQETHRNTRAKVARKSLLTSGRRALPTAASLFFLSLSVSVEVEWDKGGVCVERKL